MYYAVIFTWNSSSAAILKVVENNTAESSLAEAPRHAIATTGISPC